MDKIPAYVKNGKTVYFPSITSLRDWNKDYEDRKEKREKAEKTRIHDIEYWFNELAEDNESRLALCELIELCGGEIPQGVNICTACGSDDDGHYNNNAECQK